MRFNRIAPRISISIHAPPRGATPAVQHRGRMENFNSRPSARGDQDGVNYLDALKDISIHAPPRGATYVAQAYHAEDILFQFTPLREGRRQRCHQGVPMGGISIHAPPRGATRIMEIKEDRDIFQFTPLREGRRKRYAISANLLFNPYKSAWLNNRATQFVEIILVIFHRIIA